MSILKLYFGRKIPGLWKTSRKIALRGHTLLRELGIISQSDMDLWQTIDTKDLTASTIRGVMRQVNRLSIVEHPKILDQIKTQIEQMLVEETERMGDFYLTQKKVSIALDNLSSMQELAAKLGLTDHAKSCSIAMGVFRVTRLFPWQLALERLETGHPQIPEDLSGIRFVSSKYRFSKKEMDLIFNTPGRGLYTPVTDMPGYTDIASILKDLNERSPIFLVSLVRSSENEPWRIRIAFQQGNEQAKALSKTFDLN